MSNKTQTAVEWFVANIDWMLLKNSKHHYQMIIQKALKMQEEQTINAYNQGKQDGYSSGIMYDMPERVDNKFESGQDYFNKTFIQENEKETIIDWSKISGKYHWIAMDKGGVWFAFEKEPIMADGVWKSSYKFGWVSQSSSIIFNPPKDWKQCKFRRP